MTGFLVRNWTWIVFLVAMVAMHRRGGGCGMHGHHRSHGHQAGPSDTSELSSDHDAQAAASTHTKSEASR